MMSAYEEEGVPLVVVGQLTSLSSDALKEVVHERVHDGHSLGRDTSVRVHLLQHLNSGTKILIKHHNAVN